MDMNNIYDIKDLKERCVGCLACIDTCPKACISKDESSLGGFIYPKIDTEICINCGKCLSVCPIIYSDKNIFPQRMYATYAKDQEIRNNGSSGGIFELLAKISISKGYYVCGAAFDNGKLKHQITNNLDNLSPLLKSKYIQSDTEGIYIKIKKLLMQGEKVFFCGTPCQVAALNNVINNVNYGNLITVDFVCHGVPSQKLFDLYIKELENKYKCKIDNFSFRIKNNKYKNANGFSYTKIKGENITNEQGVFIQSPFYNAFKNYLILRKNCYSCTYTTLSRTSDITLADFWNIERYEQNFDTNQGVSMVITNTKIGQMLYDSILDYVISKEVPIGYGIDSNWALTHATVMPENRSKILESIENFGFNITENKYFKPKLVRRIYWKIPYKIRKFAKRIIRK